MFEQAAIAVRDEQGYAQLHALIDAAFDPRDVEVLLERVSKAKLRIRDFAGILKRGLLGKEAPLKLSNIALKRGMKNISRNITTAQDSTASTHG